MKRLLCLLLMVSSFSALTLAQQISLRESNLSNINSDTVRLSSIQFEDKLMIEFWAPGLPVSDIKVNSISETYEEWIQKTGFKVILITPHRPSREIIRQAKQYNWPFEIYFDPSFEFYQAISQLPTKPVVPKSYILNTNYEILDVSSKGEMVKRESSVDHYDQDFLGTPAEMSHSMNEYLTDLSYYYGLADRLRDKDQ